MMVLNCLLAAVSRSSFDDFSGVYVDCIESIYDLFDDFSGVYVGCIESIYGILVD